MLNKGEKEAVTIERRFISRVFGEKKSLYTFFVDLNGKFFFQVVIKLSHFRIKVSNNVSGSGNIGWLGMKVNFPVIIF